MHSRRPRRCWKRWSGGADNRDPRRAAKTASFAWPSGFGHYPRASPPSRAGESRPFAPKGCAQFRPLWVVLQAVCVSTFGDRSALVPEEDSRQLYARSTNPRCTRTTIVRATNPSPARSVPQARRRSVRRGTTTPACFLRLRNVVSIMFHQHARQDNRDDAEHGGESAGTEARTPDPGGSRRL